MITQPPPPPGGPLSPSAAAPGVISAADALAIATLAAGALAAVMLSVWLLRSHALLVAVAILAGAVSEAYPATSLAAGGACAAPVLLLFIARHQLLSLAAVSASLVLYTMAEDGPKAELRAAIVDLLGGAPALADKPPRTAAAADATATLEPGTAPAPPGGGSPRAR